MSGEQALSVKEVLQKSQVAVSRMGYVFAGNELGVIYKALYESEIFYILLVKTGFKEPQYLFLNPEIFEEKLVSYSDEFLTFNLESRGYVFLIHKTKQTYVFELSRISSMHYSFKKSKEKKGLKGDNHV